MTKLGYRDLCQSSHAQLYELRVRLGMLFQGGYLALFMFSNLVLQPRIHKGKPMS